MCIRDSTLDVVKNKGALLDFEELNNYEFWMAESMLIDNRMQYVINFRPKVILMYALLYGKLYIDRERLSFTRIEMSLDMQNKSKATTAILYKKPLGLRFKPQELSYLVTYKAVSYTHLDVYKRQPKDLMLLLVKQYMIK